MELHEIKELIGGGLVRDVARVRQAWIEYGGLLAKCPHKQGRKIGEWVKAEGLDFVENNEDRAYAKALFNIGIDPNVNFDACPHYHPKNVLKWLRSTGQIPTKQDGRARAAIDSAEPKGFDVHADFNSDPLHLVNAARALDVSALPVGQHEHILRSIDVPMSKGWHCPITGRTVGIVVDIRVRAFWFDTTADEGSQSATRAEPAVFEEAAFTKAVGITEQAAKILKGEAA